jgi:chromosome segregation ATPase
MDSSKILKETVERAQREVKELLAEVQASKPDRSKLDTGLKELESNLKVLGIHIGHQDPDDPDEHDPK